jgi:hypothetical protein
LTAAIARLDDWLRTAFVAHNTALEEAYFSARAEFLDDPALDEHKHRLLREGAARAGAIDELPEQSFERYELLACCRFLAVCRAHSRAYTFHHAALVKRFLEGPARSVPPARVASLSAGGPPLAEVAGLLEQLRALRADTAPLERLRSLIE